MSPKATSAPDRGGGAVTLTNSVLFDFCIDVTFELVGMVFDRVSRRIEMHFHRSLGRATAADSRAGHATAEMLGRSPKSQTQWPRNDIRGYYNRCYCYRRPVGCLRDKRRVPAAVPFRVQIV